ncbi:hypothetical protein ACO34A_02250 [Rhizobium sp. ACO-34A]|nr:hypothetical protein [Rhizobium sp. ACO-34A]ATN32625.1 hypothetical protein ACO34A_02250 [Rhizobium sp. ACO-34A]
MASLRAVYLAPEQIDKIVTPLLSDAFKDYGFNRASIKEDETFDGEPIIRVRADVKEAVPARELVKILGRIHDALRAGNDERIVFLSAPGPAVVAPAGDEDEDTF